MCVREGVRMKQENRRRFSVFSGVSQRGRRRMLENTKRMEFHDTEAEEWRYVGGRGGGGKRKR